MSQNESLEEVMRRIRARVEERNAASSQPPSSPSSESHKEPTNSTGRTEFVTANLEIYANDLESVRAEIATALEGTRQVGQINPRNPGLHNDAIQFAKKVMRRSLAWYTRPHHHFQGGAIRALQRMTDVVANHEQSLHKISQELSRHARMIESVNQVAAAHSRDFAALNELAAGLDHRIGEIYVDLKTKVTRAQSIGDEKLEQMRKSQVREITGIADEVARMRSLLDQMQEGHRRSQLEGRLRDRDFRRFVHDVRNGIAGSPEVEAGVVVPPMFPSDAQNDSAFDYFAFEDLYRGDEGLIRRRQEEYLKYFQGRDNVLDVGCGRGEFLELLRENGISANGVELGTDQYLLCKEKGLDVVQQDLFSYLESLPDSSLGGLFSAQVIEHLTASDQLRYVALTYQKTKPGSPVIFETINAQCVWAIVRNFFLDPTHVRPVHPETLKFAMESANFRNVALLFSAPLSERHIPPLELEGEVRNLQQFNQQIQNLNELLYGNQDFAAIGWH
jgi:O-antigen chain-terminating methyltransferase